MDDQQKKIGITVFVITMAVLVLLVVVGLVINALVSKQRGDPITAQEERRILDALELKHDHPIDLVKIEWELAYETHDASVKIFRVAYRVKRSREEHIQFFIGSDGFVNAVPTNWGKDGPDFSTDWRGKVREIRKRFLFPNPEL